MRSKQQAAGHGRPIAALENRGRKAVAEVGIHNEDDLRAVGPVAAYRRLKQARPRQVSRVFLYALYGR